MSNEFEVRLEVIKHISQMMMEMADVDFEKLTPEQEQIMLEDYEEVATHLLDSLSFEIKEINKDGNFSASMKIIPPNEYIDKIFAEEEVV